MNEEDRPSAVRADTVAAWATGAGIGIAVFMMTWVIANRVTAMLLAGTTAPLVAMSIAILAGAVVTGRQGWILSRRFSIH